MSDPVSTAKAGTAPARPVSLFTIGALFVFFAAFLLVVHHFYRPEPLAPQAEAPQNLAKDLAWKATRQSRRATLADLRAAQEKELSTYAWIDRAKGTVRLPIQRAMELTVERYGAHK